MKNDRFRVTYVQGATGKNRVDKKSFTNYNAEKSFWEKPTVMNHLYLNYYMYLYEKLGGL